MKKWQQKKNTSFAFHFQTDLESRLVSSRLGAPLYSEIPVLIRPNLIESTDPQIWCEALQVCASRVTPVCVLCLSLLPVDFVSEGRERLQLWKTAQAQGCLYPLGMGPPKSLPRAARKVLTVPGNQQVPIKLNPALFCFIWKGFGFKTRSADITFLA